MANYWFLTIGLITSTIIAITANSFSLFIFCRKRALRTVPNRFVINLLIVNLLSSFLLIPFIIIDNEEVIQDGGAPSSTASFSSSSLDNNTVLEHIVIEEAFISANRTNFQIIETNKILTGNIKTQSSSSSSSSSSFAQMVRVNILCYIGQSTITFVCTLSILSILLIGVNQYFGVIHSLRYHFYINKWRSMASIMASWLLAFVFALLSCLSRNLGVWSFCKERIVQPSNTIKLLNTIYAFSYFLIMVLVPFVAICVIYMCIYAAAHKTSERMRKSTSVEVHLHPPSSNHHNDKEQHHHTMNNSSLPKVHSAPNFASFLDVKNDQQQQSNVLRTNSERNNFIAVLKHKFSNASVFKYREETRAAKISVLVIFLVLFCYIPFGLTVVFNSEFVQIHTSSLFNYLALFLLIFSNAISPFLFAYRNKRVKREIGRFFGLTMPKQQQMKRPSRSFDNILKENREPFLQSTYVVPEVIVTCKVEGEKKSILKRVCNTSNWNTYKKCNFITVPDSCINTEARGSFSSASTQISSEE